MNVMSVSLLRMQNGDIGLFYCLRFSWHDLRLYVRRSADEGRTWSAAVRCMPAADYRAGGRVDKHRLNRLRVRRVSLDLLMAP